LKKKQQDEKSEFRTAVSSSNKTSERLSFNIRLRHTQKPGEEQRLKINPDTTMAQVKELATNVFDIPNSGGGNLCYAGKTLEDDQKISYYLKNYDYQTNSPLFHLIVRNR